MTAPLIELLVLLIMAQLELMIKPNQSYLLSLYGQGYSP